MAYNSGYKVNEDGSVTRTNSGGTGNNSGNNSGGSSDNSGCGWFIGIAVLIGIIFYTVKSNDDSDNEVSQVDTVETVEEVPVVAVETPSATYLNVSDNNLVFDSDGGSQEITISTDGDWEISVNVADWAQLTKYSNSVVLRVPRNTSRSSRSDYFEVRAVNYTRRVNFSQNGDDSPYAQINRIWVDHNVYYNGAKGMKIHASYDIVNMKDKNVYMYTYFYYGDNSTPLKNPYGNQLSMSSSGVAPYESTTFNDTWHFIPYTNLNMQPGYGSIDLSFDVVIKDGNGNQLDRDENNRFTLNEN